MGQGERLTSWASYIFVIPGMPISAFSIFSSARRPTAGPPTIVTAVSNATTRRTNAMPIFLFIEDPSCMNLPRQSVYQRLRVYRPRLGNYLVKGGAIYEVAQN